MDRGNATQIIVPGLGDAKLFRCDSLYVKAEPRGHHWHQELAEGILGVELTHGLDVVGGLGEVEDAVVVGLAVELDLLVRALADGLELDVGAPIDLTGNALARPRRTSPGSSRSCRT